MFELSNIKKNGIYYAYARKSRSDITLENYKKIDTLKQHTEFINKRAEELGIKINKWFKEIVSGDSISKRPEIKKMLKEIETGLIDGVIVVDIDRLARGDTIDQGTISRTFKYTNTKIITLYKIYDPKNEEDEDFFEFNLFMARKEYKAINKRQQRGRISSVLSGKYCGSEAPYGYTKVKINGDKGFTLKPNKDAKIIKTIFEKRSQKVGLNIICNYLNNLNIKPKRSDSWTPPTITSILSNPVYIGKIRWNYNKSIKIIQNGEIKKIRKKTNNEDYILVEGLHPAIINEKLFNQVQRNKTSIAPVPSNKEIKNPLSGLIKCSICKRNMIRRPYTTKIKKRAKNNLNKQELLNCLRTHKNHSLNEIAQYCGKTKYTVEKWFVKNINTFIVPPYDCWYKLKKYLNIKTNKFDNDIENYRKIIETEKLDSIACPKPHCKTSSAQLPLIEKKIITITQSYLKQKKRITKEYNQKVSTDNLKIIEILNKKQKELTRQLNKIYELVENGTYNNEEFTNRAKKIKNKINTNKKELEKLKKTKNIKPMIAITENILNAYNKTSNISDKNNILKSIIDHIDYTKLKRNSDFSLKIYFKF